MPSPSSPERPHRGRRSVFLLVALAMMLSVLYPLRQYGASKAELRGLVRREKQIEAQTAQLQKQKRRLASDAEVERLAREHLQMVRPGEVSFAITGRAPSPKPAAEKAAAQPKPKRSKLRSFWRWLTRG